MLSRRWRIKCGKETEEQRETLNTQNGGLCQPNCSSLYRSPSTLPSALPVPEYHMTNLPAFWAIFYIHLFMWEACGRSFMNNSSGQLFPSMMWVPSIKLRLGSLYHWAVSPGSPHCAMPRPSALTPCKQSEHPIPKVRSSIHSKATYQVATKCVDLHSDF